VPARLSGSALTAFSLFSALPWGVIAVLFTFAHTEVFDPVTCRLLTQPFEEFMREAARSTSPRRRGLKDKTATFFQNKVPIPTLASQRTLPSFVRAGPENT
jgi:hypothetical protein